MNSAVVVRTPVAGDWSAILAEVPGKRLAAGRILPVLRRMREPFPLSPGRRESPQAEECFGQEIASL